MVRRDAARVIETLTLRSRGFVSTARWAGGGPVVMLLHGFPDGPETFDAQLLALAEAGFRAVAPTLRGFAGESLAPDDDYHAVRMAEDVVAWADELGGRVHLVGHDWGATIGYAAIALASDRFCSFATLAIPHPMRLAEASAGDVGQQARYQYILDFQMPDAASRVRAQNYAYLHDLWRMWSPDWTIPETYLDRLGARFSEPGVVEATLAYYRQAFDVESPAGRQTQQLLSQPVKVPTLAIAGDGDGCISCAVFEQAMQEEDFPAGLETVIIRNAGHFMHREMPEEVNFQLTSWLARQQWPTRG